MHNRNQFNDINNFNKEDEFSIDISNKNWKERKNYFNKNLTIQNNNNLPKVEERLSLSYESFNHVENEKNCIMKRECPYYKRYTELKSRMKKLSFSVEKIKALNEILRNSLEKQNKLYLNLINENKNLKEELFLISSQKKFLYMNKNKRIIKFAYNSNEKEKKKININQFLTKGIKTLSKYNLKNIFDLQENTEEFENILRLYKNNKIHKKKQKNDDEQNKDEVLFTKSPSMKNFRNSNLINNTSPVNHYNLIKDFTNKQNLNFISEKMKRSFLSEDIDYETLIESNKVLNELMLSTASEKEFISNLKNASDDIYYKYYDLISLLINDYKEILKLGFRLKDFVKYSIILIESMIEGNTIQILLKSICAVLTCEKANLYILDKNSDSLFLYSSENSGRSPKRMKKEMGTVYSCFSEQKKIRIDDAQKSILCYPLIDNHEQSFGVIEAINKLIPPFNNDDEELIKYLSHQASNIFKNSSSNSDNLYLLNKLNDIINYIISLININSKYEFTEKTEKALLTIFNCSISKFYFVENDKIIYYHNLNKTKDEFDINMGIIGKVIKIKSIYGIQNVKKCIEYNSIVDIDTYDGILTFPILEPKTKNVKGVAQISYIGTIDKNNKPKDIDCKLIKKFRKVSKHWIYYH